jgi:hypothetical protein
MKTILVLTMLLCNFSDASTEDPTKGLIYYYVTYSPGHKECTRLSEDLMSCPTNDLNARISMIGEINRDVAAWALPKDCKRITDHIDHCEKK